jgi:hypothetical protein
MGSFSPSDTSIVANRLPDGVLNGVVSGTSMVSSRLLMIGFAVNVNVGKSKMYVLSCIIKENHIQHSRACVRLLTTE